MKLCLNCQRINMDDVEQCSACGNSQFSPVWFDDYIKTQVAEDVKIVVDGNENH